MIPQQSRHQRSNLFRSHDSSLQRVFRVCPLFGQSSRPLLLPLPGVQPHAFLHDNLLLYDPSRFWLVYYGILSKISLLRKQEEQETPC